MLIADAEIRYCPSCNRHRRVSIGVASGSDRIEIVCGTCATEIESGVLVTPGCIFIHPKCPYCERLGYHLDGCPALTPSPAKTTYPAGTIRLPI